MKRFLLLAVLATVCLSFTARIQAADDIKLKLADAKFKAGTNTSTELVGHNEGDGKIFYYAPGTAEWTFKASADGTFTIQISASCDPAQKVNAWFKLTIDGKDVGEEVKLTSEGEKEYKLETKLTAGEHKLAIAFTNDVYKEGEYDRNLYIHAVALTPKK